MFFYNSMSDLSLSGRHLIPATRPTFESKWAPILVLYEMIKIFLLFYHTHSSHSLL
jgi:hypothetical protein